MDGSRFDALTKTLGTAHSRRTLTRLLGGLSLGGVLSALAVREAAAALRNGGFACTRDRQCKTGNCLASGRCSCSQKFPNCRGDQTCCGRRCVSLETHPRHCGACRKRCQVNGVCDNGTCTCVQGTCTIRDATCCPATFPAPCRCSGTPVNQFTVTTTCADVNECPTGTAPCSGPNCQACCPAGSTCDTSTGTCLQQ